MAATAPPRKGFSIVAVGASAGGLEALELFFGAAGSGGDAGFVVVQHLDPTRPGLMPELLQKACAMPVAQARNRMKVKPGQVYVIPPNRELSILRGSLYLLEPASGQRPHTGIDFFLRSLADDQRENAVAVILSGMGTDGSEGVRAVREQGGQVLAQDPSQARFDSMPLAAIATGTVAVVARAEDLARQIGHAQAPQTQAESPDHKSGFERVCILLRARSGHDFSGYKRGTVMRRIERRMSVHRIERIGEYVRFLHENPLEIDLLFKELLIGVTRFFRDPPVWAALQALALPPLFAAHAPGAALRAWVAGCSSGEEAYTLAIAFLEAQDALAPAQRQTLQIFATDLDLDALAKARRGVYPAAIEADLGSARLARFFVPENGGWRIAKEVRAMVIFAQQNVTMDPPFTKLDIICCRNLLIYLGVELQHRLLPLFHFALRPGGLLMLGSAETVSPADTLFSLIDGKARLFGRNNEALRPADFEFPTRHPLKLSDTAMDVEHQAPAPPLQQLADQLLLQRFAPAAVLVNAAGDVLYISGRTGKYLEPAAGKANWNLHAMARQGLRQELEVALPQARRSGRRVVCRGIRGEEGAAPVDLTVHPIDEPAALSGLLMVVFADAASAAPPARRGGRRSPRVAELEQELARARVEMQALQEEMRTSQEELRSANEELQSTNEELTTSTEELQSLNEELQTVNVELQSKVEELSGANNDMKNLLNSTDIATIFLDNALRVRRFTTQATKLFRLIGADVGRALSDIVNDLDYPGLAADAEAVLRTLAFSERESSTADGRWYQVKIMPYRTLANVIDGVVITFNDTWIRDLARQTLHRAGEAEAVVVGDRRRVIRGRVPRRSVNSPCALSSSSNSTTTSRR